MRLHRTIRTIATLALGASCALQCACTTAATVGDETIRMASLGRVQATPFTDTLETRDCRQSLDATYGFARESRAMKNGVFVVQTYDCKADHVIARVSLNNYTEYPMRCFAETETGEQGVTIAAESAGSFEYSYADQVYMNCRQAD